ncbi:MAG TPA: carbamoyltransferase HypF [Spirochaetota bacterium]|nr:carbamoyltransferase HypF [Spirochaetota bacterium]HPI89378.1 carbamoyltransferase HypF [Spirochaetota bacterium]
MVRQYRIRVKGIVQGVGFRPFIYQLAHRHGLTGSVINDTAGVLIHAQGREEDLETFINTISSAPPPLSSVYQVNKEELEPGDFPDFIIGPSGTAEERTVFYSPDIALCEDCLREFFDPGDRRYHYHFITCINCGPRFSIVNDIPYDRATTSMAPFALCPKCEAEYRDSADRRFHTQPTACGVCGPRMLLHDREGNVLASAADEVARMTVSFLKEGKIGALKGVGGYHLAADALNHEAVGLLRTRKQRPFKPFALMAGSIGIMESFVEISAQEKKLLLSKERPIVLLRERKEYVARNVAPGITWHGLMLPYTPFHHHLFSLAPDMVLVMTSGNLSDEPIVYRDRDAFERLAPFADFFVTYNREIIAQNDDSVLFVEMGMPFFIRRSRGYIPVPLPGRITPKKILAMGGDMKNSFALARSDFVIISQYLGDMADVMTHEAFRSAVAHFIKIFDASPEVIVSDLHPGYHTTLYADELAGTTLKRIQVQHHHAHITSVLEERNLDGPVLGIAFDGTGYGTDGTLWGSEFLVADRKNFIRAGHFSNFSLPGGESAIRDVWKIGLSLLYQAYGRDFPVMEKGPRATLLMDAMERGINSPLTCSIGRIFDGMAGILGICRSVSSEAEAAMLLEEAAARGSVIDREYIIPFTRGEPYSISTEELTRFAVGLLQSGHRPDDIAATFHDALSRTAVAVAKEICADRGLDTVVLSGGVFHNRILLRAMYTLLANSGLKVLVPEKVPVNDGCIALGQVAVARALLETS